MPPITALIHTHNDEARIGRTLETLRPCDELLIIDHGSTDRTREIAREHGARIVVASDGVPAAAHAQHDWVLCLLPSESLSETLEAALFEWKQSEPHDDHFAIAIREETAEGWKQLSPATRLANQRRLSWDRMPRHDPGASLLKEDLLRF